MAASKYLHDTDSEEAMSNVDWSTEFDVELRWLNRLEIRFLRSLEWNLFVSKQDFTTFVSRHFDVVDNTASNKSGSRTQPVYVDPTASYKPKYHSDRHLKAQWPMAKVGLVSAVIQNSISHSLQYISALMLLSINTVFCSL